MEWSVLDSSRLRIGGSTNVNDRKYVEKNHLNILAIKSCDSFEFL